MSQTNQGYVAKLQQYALEKGTELFKKLIDRKFDKNKIDYMLVVGAWQRLFIEKKFLVINYRYKKINKKTFDGNIKIIDKHKSNLETKIKMLANNKVTS